MARRYGGEFSPQGRAAGAETPGKAPPPPRRFAPVDPGGARCNLLFLPAVLLVLTTFGGGPVSLATGLVGAAAWTFGAFMTREGLKAEVAFHDRKTARRPALPRKLVGTLAIAAGTALAGWAHGTDVVGSVIYAVVAGALHVAAFGIDPLRDKNVPGVDQFQQDRVARVVDEAEAHLRTMRQAIDALRDRALTARVAAFEDRAREMIRTVEEDPRDLTSARKFLGVYLMGVRDASIKFADIYARNRSAGARADYEALLTDLDDNFAARTQKLIADDRSDLTVEIEVLRDRLQREGVRAPDNTE